MRAAPAAGRANAVLGGVWSRLQALCAPRGEEAPSVGDVVSAAVRLGAKRLLLADAGAARLRMRCVGVRGCMLACAGMCAGVRDVICRA
jgi:hypothetical protein